MYSHIEDKNYNHLVCVILGGSEKECKLHGLAHVGEHMCLLSCFDNDESYTTFGYTCIDHAVLYFATDTGVIYASNRRNLAKWFKTR